MYGLVKFCVQWVKVIVWEKIFQDKCKIFYEIGVYIILEIFFNVFCGVVLE